MTNQIDISKVINENCIKLNLSSHKKLDALEELIELLYAEEAISSKSEFLEDVLKREEEGITGIGKGIAIPHGKSKIVLKTSIAIGVSKHDIEWESFDDDPIRCVILFAVKDTELSEHVMILSKVAVALSEEGVIQKLKMANDKYEIINILSGE